MNKKIVTIFLILFLIILIGGYFGIKYVKDKKQEVGQIEEYIPQEEITDNQLRQTIVTLYFVSKETDEIVPEARLVDIKEILNLPYEKLMQLLIEGPKNDKLRGVLSIDTKILKTYIENDCVTIDFSSEFLNYNKDEKDIMIKTIVNTMTELIEVNNVKIIIDGNENEEFNEIYSREKV